MGHVNRALPVDERLLEQVYSEWEAPFDGVTTPLPTWNRVCGSMGKHQGLATGWLVTIGGGPGQRKSWLAANIAASALKQDHSVLYVSGELSRSEVIRRVGLAVSPDLGFRDLRRGSLDSVLPQLRGLLVNDVRVRVRLSEVKADIEAYAKAGVKLVIVDYAQQMLASAVRTADELKDWIETFRGLAIEYRFVAVVVSQLTRESLRMDQSFDMPSLSSLANGATLERHSDQVFLVGFSSIRHGSEVRTWLGLRKNRHGWACDIPVRWDTRSMRLEEADNAEGWPQPKAHARYVLEPAQYR